MSLSEKEFLEISSKTPIVNVDLLIYNEKNEILLSWRDDEFDIGWHFPGRCVRVGETLKQAVINCSILEIGYRLEPLTPSKFESISEIIIFPRKGRNHFYSFLYKCYLDSFEPLVINFMKKENDAGYLKWFSKCPDNLLECQKQYKKYFINLIDVKV